MSINAVSSIGGASCRAGASDHSVLDSDAPPGIEQHEWDSASRQERLELIQESIRMESQCGGLPKQAAYTPRPTSDNHGTALRLFQVGFEARTDSLVTWSEIPSKRPLFQDHTDTVNDPDENLVSQGTLEAVPVFADRDSQRDETLLLAALGSSHPAQFESYGEVQDNADRTVHFDKNGTLPVTANRIPETVDHSWIQQALWRELPAHAQGALYGFAGSVLHGLYDTALFLGRSVVQIGDMLIGLANHDHPYMQELWGKQKAISDGLIYSISHPIQTARSLIQVGKEKYHAALAEEDPFEQSRGLGNITGAVWQALLSGATATPAVAKAGAVTARVVGEVASAPGPISGSIQAQRGVLYLSAQEKAVSELTQKITEWGNKSTSPALKHDPYHPDVVEARIKPPYEANIAHNPKSSSYNPKKSPEPADAELLYQDAILGKVGTWYAINNKGDIYRYFPDNAGGAHFSGVIEKAKVPTDVLRYFGVE